MMAGNLMVVSVQLHSTLQRQTPQGLLRQVQVDLPDGSSLGDLILRLDIKVDPEEILLVVNGRTAETTQALSDHDEVHLIPAISGGS
jgi:sulfur carrier protein ThiS